MKSQRRNSQQKKSQRKSKSSRNKQNQAQNRNNQNKNKGVQKKSQSKGSSYKRNKSKGAVKRRYQKQKKTKNQRRRRNQRLRSRRKNRSKQAQKGGYSGLDYSILPCETTDGGVSVPDFNSTADASPKICSDSLDMVTDAEYGVGSGASVLSGLSDLVRGGTTQVIDEKTADSGDGLTDEERRQAMDNRVDESTYRRIYDIPEASRSATQRQTLQALGTPVVQDARWSRLTDAGLTGYYDAAKKNPAPFPEEYNLPE